MQFLKARWLKGVLIGAAAALVPLTAFADFVNVSGNGVTVVTLAPGAETFALDLGTICAGAGTSAPVSLAIGARSHPDGTFFIFADGSATPSPATVTYTYTTSVNDVAIPSSVQQATLSP